MILDFIFIFWLHNVVTWPLEFCKKKPTQTLFYLNIKEGVVVYSFVLGVEMFLVLL
jgi:hypothetical protein